MNSKERSKPQEEKKQKTKNKDNPHLHNNLRVTPLLEQKRSFVLNPEEVLLVRMSLLGDKKLGFLCASLSDLSWVRG